MDNSAGKVSSERTGKWVVVLSGFSGSYVVCFTINLPYCLVFEGGTKRTFFISKTSQTLCIPCFSLLKHSVSSSSAAEVSKLLPFFWGGDSLSKKIAVLLDWLLRVGDRYHCAASGYGKF